MMPSLSKVFAAGAAALVLAAAAPVPASASTAMRFSVRPDSDGSLSPGADYFVIEAAPGDVVEDALEVSNPGARRIEVRLASVDAATAQFGGVDYTPSEARPRAVGSWITLEETVLELAPGEVEMVSFRVAVPDDAPPGVNLGGIAAWTPPRRPAAEREGLTATTEVQTRRVVAVQMELPGPAEPVLEIDDVTAAARPDGVYLQVDLRNTGHGFAEGEGTLEVPGHGFSTEFPLDKVVPGTGVGYPVRWGAGAPASGTYPVRVEIDYGSGLVEYSGDVVVGSALRAELADRGIGGEERRGFPTVPVAVALVACCAAAVVLRRRRTARSGAAGPKAPPVAPVAERTVSPPSPPSRITPPPPPPSPRITPPPPPPPVGAAKR